MLSPRCLIVPGLLCCLLAVSCRRAPEHAGTWDDFPAARSAPAETEGFLLVRDAGSLHAALAPALAGLADDPSVRTAWQISPWGRILGAVFPETEKAAGLLADFASGDAFVILGPGTAAQLAMVQQVKRLFAAARLRNLFTPLPPSGSVEEAPDLLDDPGVSLESAAFTEVMVPLPPAMEAALDHFVKAAQVPPLILGSEVPADGRLPARLASWVEGLPPHVSRDTFDFEGEPFVRVNVLVANLIPREAAVRARDLLAANIGDPYNATLIVRGLLAKSTTVSFGRARGFFLVCIGWPEGVPVLAGTAGSSLAAAPSMQPLTAHIGSGAVAVFHADALIAGLAAAPPPVGEYLDAALESALEFAPSRRIRPLREAAASLRTSASGLFQPRVSAASGVIRRDDGRWSAEMFGGSVAPRLSTENARALLGAAPAFALVWNEQWEEGYARRLLEFTGRLAAFSADWTDALGPDFPEAGQAAGPLLRLLQGPASRLAAVDPALWDLAFGGEVALAMDFVAPSPPVPPEVSGAAVLPRFAVAARTGDRRALEDIWGQLIAPSEANPLSTWPPPVSRTLPHGAELHEYPMPSGGAGLGAAVAVDKSRWVLSTSPALAEAVVEAPAGGKRPLIQSVQWDTAPWARLATDWAKALEADPSLVAWMPGFLPSSPSALRAAALFLQSPRRFRYEARWENGTIRRSMALEPAP